MDSESVLIARLVDAEFELGELLAKRLADGDSMRDLAIKLRLSCDKIERLVNLYQSRSVINAAFNRSR